MAVALRIVEPAHGAGIAGTAPVRLRGEVVGGSAAGLFFTWYSTLNPAATGAHPELNAADHSAAKLDWTTPLDVGTHVLTLAAADRDGSSLAAINAVTRAGVAGGAPGPANPTPCVVHRLMAVLRTPAADGAALSRAGATLEMRAPLRWAKQDPPGSGPYVSDAAYHAVNGIRYRFRFAPDGPPPAGRTAEIVPAASAFAYFVDAGLPYLRWQGPLPANLANGNYLLTLVVETLDAAASHTVVRRVKITA